MKKQYLSFLSFSLICFGSIAQKPNFPIPCNTYNAMEEAFQLNPSLRTRYNLVQSEMELDYNKAVANSNLSKVAATVYTVPVVFHILHQGGAENVSDADINTAMAQINKDYRKTGSDVGTIHSAFAPLYVDAEIRFELAKRDPNGVCTNGIIRHYDANTNWDQSDFAMYAYSGSGINRWPTNKYLNIYIVKCIASASSPCPPSGGFIVGYTYKPGTWPTNSATDAIVYRYDFLAGGTDARSLSHEIGHWLNLSHTFGNTNDPGITCGNDGITDTPDTKGYFSTCPGANAGPFTGCTPTENMENFMDYSSCPKMFTQMQVTKMRSALTSPTSGRSGLWTGTNLTATGLAAGYSCLPTADFTANRLSICAGSTISYTNLSQYGASGSILWDFEGGSPSTSTANTPVITYNTPGTYSVGITATNTFGTADTIKPYYIVVEDIWSSYIAPITHDFEDGKFPWRSYVTNLNAGSATWEVNPTNGALGTATSIYLNNAGQSNTGGHVDIFDTPSYDFHTTSGLTLSYYYAYAKKAATQADIFKLQISIDCGATWQNVLGYPGTATMASNSAGTTVTPLNPTAAEWKQAVIASGLLSATTPNPNGKLNVKFRFSFQSDPTLGSSNNLFIDQINLSGIVGISDLENSIGLSIYPNPTNLSSTIDFNIYDNEKIKINITDIVGRVIEETDKVTITGNNATYTVNKNGQLAKGVYFINLEINNSVITKKLIIQ